MIVNRFKQFSRVYRGPEPGDEGSGDRGDTWTPTEDEPKPEEKKVEPESKKAEPKPEEKKTEPKPEPEESKKDTRIPVARHKEILDKEREARADVERRLAKYEGADKVAATNESITKAQDKVITLETEYNALVAEGKTKDATDKMREIRILERGISDQRTTLATEAATSRAIETVRYETAVERLEAAYPQIDPDNEAFDEELSKDVVVMSRAYVRDEGLTPTQAIQKAVKRLCTATTAEQKQAVDVTPRADKEDAKTLVERERRAEAALKAKEAADKQPPSTKSIGADSDRAGGAISAKDVLKMDQKDFSKLDEKTLARMRGDEL